MKMTEDPTTKLSFWTQILGTFSTGIVVLQVGVAFAYPTRALPYLKLEPEDGVRLTKDQESTFAAMYMLCAIACCPLGGFASKFFGRRKTMFVGSLIGVCGWILLANSWDKTSLFLGRIITTASGSGLSATTMIYISEISHPSIRGSLLVTGSIFVFCGFLIVFGPGYFVPDWRILAYVCAVPGIIGAIIMFLLPETPYWLMEKNRMEAARKSLNFYRGKGNNTNQELDEIANKLKEKSSTNQSFQVFRRLTSSAFLRPFYKVGILKVISQLGESHILMVYMIQVFKESHSSITPELVPIFVGIVQVSCAIISSSVIRRVKPKILFIIGSSMVALGDFVIATLSCLKEHSSYRDVLIDKAGSVPLYAVLLIFTSHALCTAPIIAMSLAENFPTDIGPISIGITQASAFIFGAINIKLFPLMTETFHFYGAFFFYGCIQLIVLSWGAHNIPDNRGLSLVKVEQNFERKNKIDNPEV